MAELSEQDRVRVQAGIQHHWSQLLERTGFSASDLKAAIDATDTWINDEEGNYNTALPNPFKTNATQAQKTLLFNIVAAMRVSPAFARKLVGGFD